MLGQKEGKLVSATLIWLQAEVFKYIKKKSLHVNTNRLFRPFNSILIVFNNMFYSLLLCEQITFSLAIPLSLDIFVVIWFLLCNTFLWGKYSEMELLVFEYVYVQI